MNSPRPRLLDLYCCAGGAAVGYHRAGFDVVAVAIPTGHAGFLHPRSGLAAQLGLSIINTPGTIDAGYRGEIKVPLINHDRDETIVVRRGDRIAQLVVQPVTRVVFDVVDELPDSTRGAGGFGSTGRA